MAKMEEYVHLLKNFDDGAEILTKLKIDSPKIYKDIKPIYTNLKLYKDENKIASIVIHGGAGKPKKKGEETLNKALKLGKSLLIKNESAVSIVHSIIKYLENSGEFNAGLKGSANDEMDACIMDGSTQKSGTVISIKNVKNPISVAHKVLETPNLFVLSGSGASKFANQTKFLAKLKRKTKKFGTVGCVCLDGNGNLAAGTSTGGISNKPEGRVGDVGIVGAGTFANKQCAISCTGIGEYFIQHMVAHSVACIASDLGLKRASEMVIKKLPPKSGGFIGVDKDGNVVHPSNIDMLYKKYP